MITHQIGPIASGFRPAIDGNYWRIRVLENFSNGSTPAISADNIQMRAVVGGANLSTDPLKAISDSEFSGAYLDDYAFNGINSQFFVSSNFNYGTHWIGYNFGVPVNIVEIVWSKRPDNFGRNEALTIALVQYSSDGINWITDWAIVTPATWGTGAETRTFRKLSGGKHFWRVRPATVQGGNFSYPFSTAEIEFRTTPGGPDQCTNGFAVGAAMNNRTQAFDNITNVPSNYALSTSNLNNNTSGGIWIGYAFDTPKEITEISYQVRGDGFGANEAMISGFVESSNDLVNWTIEWIINTPATWVNNSTESRVFTKP
jgi:hypothetical protein